MNTCTSHHDSYVPPKWILTIAIVLLLAWLFSELKEIVTLLLVGYCLAYLINPVVSFLQSKGVPRSLGVILTGLVLLGLIVLVFVSAGPTLARDYGELMTRFPEFKTRIMEWGQPYLERLQVHLPQIQSNPDTGLLGNILSLIDIKAANNILTGTAKALLKGYSVTLTVLNLVLLPFIVYYLSISFSRIHSVILNIFPKGSRQNIINLFKDIDFYISAFVRGQLLICMILALLYTIGLGIVGIELWFLLGLLAGFLNIVPYLGFAVGIVASSLMALITFGDFSHVLYVWLVFFVVQGLEGMVITPKIIGDKVGLSPLAVILALLAGGKLFGFLGILLAVPGAAIIKVLLSHWKSIVPEELKPSTSN